jgi:phosphoenolpyruvate-protein phosphotransferase/dihydroxyacetone kinase phosphotransfer subunit
VVGLVLVSHSAKLAEGAAELAREMAGPDVPIEPAGGLDEDTLGTDATRVLAAIERAERGDGVLVLMDLGSAVLSAELALDLLDEERRARVRLTSAPLVEGAVAAGVAARIGSPLETVAEEARNGLQGKAAHLDDADVAAAPPAEAPEGGLELSLTLRNPLGLHARPAARVVETVARFDADVSVTNSTTGRGPASARSVNALATLGARQGHELLVRASGPRAGEALAALEELAADDFGDTAEVAPPTRADRAPAPEGALAGLPGAPGIAVGPARHLGREPLAAPTTPATDSKAEWRRLEEALENVRSEIRDTRASVAVRAGEYSARIFDAHVLFLDDEALLEPARRAILEEGRNAADAWSSAAEALAADYEALDDAYQRERAADVRAVARQVVQELTGAPADRPKLEGAGIVVAADLTPADTAALDPVLVRAVATARGGPTSHSVILARALGLPAVVGVGPLLLEVPEGAELLVDGAAGAVWVEPDPDVVARAREQAEAEERARRTATAASHEPAVTRDGHRVEVFANAGSRDDARAAVEHGAEGIGLLRTEFVFLGRDTLPDEDEQVAAYGAVAEALEGRPLVVRTLDVGADKPLPFLPRPQEANPFLGVRGIRLTLAEPELFATQLRAILRVAAEHPIKVMFPMVATLDELWRAREALSNARAALAAAGVAADDPLEVGVMVEVPAVAIQAEAFAAEADFLSVGTNDLAQYTLAAERGNADLAALGDALEPAVLRLIELCGRAVEERGGWLGVCGELASDPAAAPVLVGLGVTELSASPPAVPAVKQAVRSIDSASARALAAEALRQESAAAVRRLLASVKLPS